MTWGKRNIYLPEYEFTSRTKHGDRFKRNGTKQVSVATLETECKNISDMKILILLSHNLNVPVHFNYAEPQMAFIEIVARETIDG